MEKPEEVIREKDLIQQARERAQNLPIPAINTQDLETVKGPETQEVTDNANDQ
ncbi:hypothetical protein phiK7B1_139 [Pseudomonas phage phiK7B1]|nr:hypothetical protein phiK7B1_139 [Pseudomonas phage phiK7B1]